jgi:hypothetical protein
MIPPSRPRRRKSIIQIADSLAATQPEEAAAALTKVLAVITDPAIVRLPPGGAEKNLEIVRLRDDVADGRPV